MKVGSLVECVRVYIGASDKFGVMLPTKGKYYTIRDISRFGSEYGVLLEEIINNKVKFVTGYEEPYFPAWFFVELLPPLSITIEQFEYEKA